MKFTRGNRLSVICITLGGVLILAAAVVLVVQFISADVSAKNAKEILAKTENLIPQVIDKVPAERGNNMMPSMEIDGVNVIGLIEVPLYGIKLPVHAGWNTDMVQWIPCRFSGSIYDRSLIIGTGEGEGQFECADTIDLGALIYITDMEGGRYCYRVSDIDRAKHADRDTLESEEYDLSIFVKNSLSMEYIIIRCKTTG